MFIVVPIRVLSPYYREGEPVDGNASPWDPRSRPTGRSRYLHGVAEHAVLHLLYTRFFTKALRDAGVLKFDSYAATAQPGNYPGRTPVGGLR